MYVPLKPPSLLGSANVLSERTKSHCERQATTERYKSMRDGVGLYDDNLGSRPRFPPQLRKYTPAKHTSKRADPDPAGIGCLHADALIFRVWSSRRLLSRAYRSHSVTAEFTSGELTVFGMASSKEKISFPCNVSGWFTFWKVSGSMGASCCPLDTLSIWAISVPPGCRSQKAAHCLQVGPATPQSDDGCQ